MPLEVVMVEGDPAGAAKMLQEAIKLSKDRAVFRV